MPPVSAVPPTPVAGAPPPVVTLDVGAPPAPVVRAPAAPVELEVDVVVAVLDVVELVELVAPAEPVVGPAVPWAPLPVAGAKRSVVAV